MIRAVWLNIDLSASHSLCEIRVDVCSLVIPGVPVWGWVIALDSDDVIGLIRHVEHGVVHQGAHAVGVDAELRGAQLAHVRLHALVGGEVLLALPLRVVNREEWEAAPAVEEPDAHAALRGLARLVERVPVRAILALVAPLHRLVYPALLRRVEVGVVALLRARHVEADVRRVARIRSDGGFETSLNDLLGEEDVAGVEGPHALHARLEVGAVLAVLLAHVVHIALGCQVLEHVLREQLLLGREVRRVEH